MIQSGFGTGSTIGFIIGVLLLLNYQIDINFNFWQLIIPAVLILIGIRIMFQGAFRKKVHFDENYTMNGEPSQGPNFSGSARSDYSAVFSSNHVHVTDQFYSTSLSAVFGAIVLDLRDAVITGDCEINASAVFGGIDIFLPQGVKVKINNVPVFGGVSNKHPQSADPAAPTVYLNSTCMFGGIDLK
jgi:predicted membrane protein